MEKQPGDQEETEIIPTNEEGNHGRVIIFYRFLTIPCDDHSRSSPSTMDDSLKLQEQSSVSMETSWHSCPFLKPSKNNQNLLPKLLKLLSDDNSPVTTTIDDNSTSSTTTVEEVQTPVSTVDLNLSLWFSTSSPNSSTNNEKIENITAQKKRINYTAEEIAEEERLEVTTKLSLYDYRFPWKMTKKLTASDVGNLSRLMLESDWAKKYFLPYLNIIRVESQLGVPVRVFDYDTGTEHELAFKLWKSSNCFVLKKGWVKEFVKRRDLKVKDEIGMVCDLPLMGSRTQPTLKIYFRVLQRA